MSSPYSKDELNYLRDKLAELTRETRLEYHTQNAALAMARSKNVSYSEQHKTVTRLERANHTLRLLKRAELKLGLLMAKAYSKEKLQR